MHFVPRTENSVPEQQALVDEVLSNKPDALVFSPSDPKAFVPAVDKFTAAGIAVVNVIDKLAGGQAIAYVGNDDYDLAVTTARYLFKAMGGKGNVVMLEGPPTLPTAVARSRGFNDALKEFPDVKLLAAKSANYARPVALQNMRDFLRAYPQIDGVLAANDPMAIGANEALKAAGKKALVVGINASAEVLDLHQVGRDPGERRLQRLHPGLPRRRDRDAPSEEAGGAQGGDPQVGGDRQDQLPAVRDAGGEAHLPDARQHRRQVARHTHERSQGQRRRMDRLRAVGGAEALDRGRLRLRARARRDFRLPRRRIPPATAISRSRTRAPRSRR